VTPEQRRALAGWLVALADDELILGHRDSEWCGHAPILEEDIAFANLALDELGHAKIWYTLAAGLLGEDPETYPDRMIFFRDAADFRNAPLVELPGGDWAFSMLRQYLFDAAEGVRLEALAASGYRPLAEAALKIRPEELYHRRHTSTWIQRLGLGTAESHERTQRALDELWPYALNLHAPIDGDDQLVVAGWVPEPGELQQAWEGEVRPWLTQAGLSVPSAGAVTPCGRDRHSPHLAALVAEMQSVARLQPAASW
jgi:ring-1,2-phenylacetyl-CoA epoxidase subunit PaaC